MDITDGYTNGSYREVASWQHSNEVIVPFTGMLSSYLFAAINAGVSAPFYYADTDIESLFYATAERNEFRIHNWLRANGGIDAWMGDGRAHYQINPSFDVEEELEAQRWDDYSDYIADGGWSTDGQLELHGEFMELDEFTINDKKETNMYGNMSLEDICIESAQEVGWELYGWWNFQINLWRWFITNETDTEAKSIVSKAIHRFSLSNSISIEEEELHQTLREWKAEDEGPVEGVDSHAYYGPMTTLTNFIEAQRDREFD